MFTNISWADYGTVVVLLLIAWYLFVGLRYYSHELKEVFLHRSPQGKPEVQKPKTVDMLPNESHVSLSVTDPQTDYYQNDPLDQVEALAGSIKEAVAGAVSDGRSKEMLLTELQQALTEFPILAGSPFKEMINDLILSECEKQGFARLMAEELETLWR